jgi:peptidoglycan/xylan/chitin deacetylase (PgdA/CDA1 family)
MQFVTSRETAESGVADPTPREMAAPWRPRQLLRRAMAATLPSRLLLVRGRPGDGRLCLTFDDGPHPVHTPRILDLLRANGVRATFFVIGKNARRYPELLRRIVDEGHALGHHSFSHAEPHLTSSRQLMAEIAETRDVIDAATGRRPRLFRPPHGKLTAGKLWALWHSGFTVVLWNRDPKDFARASADELRAWVRGRPMSGGDVVLLHDTVSHTADVLPELISSVRQAGLAFATVDELLS